MLWKWCVTKRVCGCVDLEGFYTSSAHVTDNAQESPSLPLEVPFSEKPLVLWEGRKMSLSTSLCSRLAEAGLWAWDASSTVEALCSTHYPSRTKASGQCHLWPGIGISGLYVAVAELASPSKILLYNVSFSTWKGQTCFQKQDQLNSLVGEGNVFSIHTSLRIIFVNLRCKLFVESQLHPL